MILPCGNVFSHWVGLTCVINKILWKSWSIISETGRGGGGITQTKDNVLCFFFYCYFLFLKFSFLQSTFNINLYRCQVYRIVVR